MGDDTEWLKLPTEDKVAHKAWKARLAGYEEATKLFKVLGEEKSPEFSKYLGLVKKFVVDNNAIAQEKALDAVLAFVENAAVAGRTTQEVVAGIILKCLNASRTKTKEKGIEIILMYIEIEKQEFVQDELIKGLSNKQPKVVAGCVTCLRLALRDFGSKVITIKPLVKQIQKLLEDRDKTVREEGKQLVIEMYRWVGAALRPQLANLKPVQVTELESEFENISPGAARQTRYLRSQQELKTKMEEQAAVGGVTEVVTEDAGVSADVDPYDLIDAVDILGKIPKDYYEKIEAKKWQERKEMLEVIHKLTENPKLEQGDYHDLVKSLKKVVAKDTNVMLVTIAAKCMVNLAKGLRKKFTTHATMCIEVILEKFKEKKATVVSALKEAIYAIYLTTTLESISESIIEALGHKTPAVKAETASFLSRCFSMATPSSLPKKLLKAFITPLLKTVTDTAPEVREASFSALGMAMKVVGEKPIAPFLTDIDAIKLGKIKEYCEKAVLLNRNGEPRGAASSSASKPAVTAPAAATTSGPTTKQPSQKPVGKSKADGSSSSSGGHDKVGGGPRSKAVRGKATSKKESKEKSEKEEKLEPHLAEEEVDEKAANFLPPESVTGLSSLNWKERLAAIEKLSESIKMMKKEEIPAQVCVRVIAKKPGLKENNFQVLKLKVELLGHLASHSNYSKTSASYCISELVDKIGDIKSGSAVQETLLNIAEATSLEYVSDEVIGYAFSQKNPKNQSESLNWLIKALQEFGFKIRVKPVVECVKKALAATNPTIRTAAINTLGTMYLYMGPPLRVFFESEKAALLQQIDVMFEKVKDEKPPRPTRGKVVSSANGGDEGVEDDEDKQASPDALNVADLVPRNDISDLLTADIISEMNDKNWKVRNEALQKVSSILNEAKFITPNIGSLPESLKLRLGDSNKILATSALTICQTLATAMGPNIKQHIRIIGPGIINCLGDNKATLRSAALTTLNKWLEQTGSSGFILFIEVEIFAEALMMENPNLRSELLGFLSAKLPSFKKLPQELNGCIPHLFSCLEDRNGEVRKKAQEAVVPFMTHLGYEAMYRQATKLKPTSKDQIMNVLEKSRLNMPEKPSKSKLKSAPPVQDPGPVVTVAAQESDDDQDKTSKSKISANANSKNKGKLGTNKKSSVSTSRSKKNAQDEDSGPVLKANRGKESRIKDEKALKTLKWNFTTPRGEYMDQLKQQMDPTFNKTLIEQLFHADFKNHLKAIDSLQKVVEDHDATISNLDLLMKWVTLRFFDTNTSVLLRALDYVQNVFLMLSSQDYHLQEYEAACFVPYLVNKVGDPKDNVKKNIREIFKLVCKVYPASKMFNFIIDGLKSKNSKQRAECLEELGQLIEVYGINVCQPAPAQALKLIAHQISDRDNSVRSAALNTIVAAYCILGDTVHKYIGNLSDKEAGMLEERIKRSAQIKPQPVITSKSSPDEKQTRTIQFQSKQSTQDSPKSNLPKQHNRESLLDFEEEDPCVGDEYDFVKHDIDDVLYQPIKLPETKTRARPPSPAAKLIHTSRDTNSAVDLIISQVASNDIDTSRQALAQIDGLLKDPDKCDLMQLHTDQFLVTCTVQLRMVYSKHMSEANFNMDGVVRLYKCLLASMLTLFECKSLAKDASRDVLRDLVHNLITILLDNRLDDMSDGPQIVRSVNVIVVKIVEKSDATCIMSALIKLLHQTVEAETSSPKYLELIMKGLWKMVRMLPEIINDLDVSKIIKDMDSFLKAFPGRTWKQKSNDMPMRTIKTILHSLAKLKGSKIMSHLELIETSDNQTTEIEIYLRRILKNGIDSGNMVAKVNKENEQMNGSPNIESNKEKKDNMKSSKRLSKCTHDMLADIFKKIGSKENTREGLNELYDFKQKYPEADLDPFLKKSSQFFQSYIERGLKSIEIEREGKMKTSASAPNMCTADGSLNVPGNIQAVTADDMSASIYRERLKVLRARCGFENVNNCSSTSNNDVNSEKVTVMQADIQRSDSNSSLSSNSSTDISKNCESFNLDLNKTPAPSDVSDLKKRLQRIKKAAHSQNL